MELKDRVQMIIDEITRTRGEDILVYDFTSVNPFIDRVIICSAKNMRQVNAIAQNIKDKCRECNLPVRVEGNDTSRWILIDVDTIIVHVFFDEERAFYHLERLYADLPRLEQDYDL